MRCRRGRHPGENEAELLEAPQRLIITMGQASSLMRRVWMLVKSVAVTGTVGAVLSACGQAAGTVTSVPPAEGTVQGTVTAAPTCPVEQAGHACPPRPVSGVVSVVGGGGPSSTATIGKDGAYRLSIPAGTYTLKVRSPSAFPTCPSVTVVVTRGSTSHANIACDTGIR